MDVSSRLFRLLRAIAEDQVMTIGKFIEQGDTLLDNRLREWEKKLGLDGDTREGKKRQQQKAKKTSDYSPYPQQLVEDLKLFNLTPPCSLDKVRKARNSEMKKFHPDKYSNDPAKKDVAKQIVQIYNAAYDRLKVSLNVSV